MNKTHFEHHGNMEPALRVVPMPKDTNQAGDIFGGWIMSQVDMAGSIVATQVTHSRVVTVAVTEFLFKQPVYVGDLISCYVKVLKIGKTSITVSVDVCAQRDRFNQSCVKVTEAKVVYVALDEKGEPKKISQ